MLKRIGLLLFALLMGTVFQTTSGGEPLNSPYAVSGKFRDHRTKELEEQHKLGVEWRRIDCDWWSCEREKGKWTFDWMDGNLADAEKSGITLLPILTWRPEWAVPVSEHLDEWAEYVRRVVTRYKGRIRYYEVWNEQNSGEFGAGPDKNYAELLVRTYREIKAIDPDIQVGYGGCSGDGIPLHFMEGSFWCGAAKNCDFIAFHPYHWRGVPEMIIDNVTALKTLMKKYNIADKPIWITEVGWSTARSVPFYDKIMPSVLKELGFDPSETTAALLCDYANSADGPFTMLPEQNFKTFKNRITVTFDGIKNLDVKKTVLIPSYSEYFPEDKIPLLVDYVRRGGTIFLSSGLPFYYSFRPYEGKGIHTAQVNGAAMKEFHMGWETWWTGNGVPGNVKFLRPAKKFKSDFILDFHDFARFLTVGNLKPGDEFIPVIEAGTEAYTGAVMGIYKLNSDLKGNVIVCLGKLDYDSVTEQSQAELLPRTYLCALGSGVERVFWYTYRDIAEYKGEREGHFGIVESDFTPKPANAAFRALIERCPNQSSRPVLSRKGQIYSANWKTPDGKTTWAVWTTASNPIKQQLQVTGRIEAVYNLSGEQQNIPADNVYELSGSLIYLVGPEWVIAEP